jgi:hypothetical protein
VPGGKFDSSKTRVRPVFDELGREEEIGCRSCSRCCADAQICSCDLTLTEGYWEPHEKSLSPPVSLLSWFIRNLRTLGPIASDSLIRRRLATGDPEIIERALHLLRTEGATRGWHILEGPTHPDVFLVARDALVVVEGKRTEPNATVDTAWLKGRHQIWRHIDAAWEIRGHRAVYGFFIVESGPQSDDVPRSWLEAGHACLDPVNLLASFPHRSAAEVSAIDIAKKDRQHQPVCNFQRVHGAEDRDDRHYEGGNRQEKRWPRHGPFHGYFQYGNNEDCIYGESQDDLTDPVISNKSAEHQEERNHKTVNRFQVSVHSWAVAQQNENVRFVQSRNVRFHGWPRGPWNRSGSL